MCACCAQDEFFWHLEPLPCKPERLPTFDASHEMDMKRKRDGDRGRPVPPAISLIL